MAKAFCNYRKDAMSQAMKSFKEIYSQNRMGEVGRQKQRVIIYVPGGLSQRHFTLSQFKILKNEHLHKRER